MIIRPRGGDFLYSAAEHDVMLRDIAVARDLGADGIVIGALQRDGAVRFDRTREMIEAARPLSVTFHRAFDVCRDPAEALETLVGLGASRVLTSGQAPTALEGAPTIAALVRQARGRIAVLAGGAIREENVRQVIEQTGVREVHLRATSQVASRMQHRNPRVIMGKAYAPDDFVRSVTDADQIRRIVSLARG